MGRSIEHVQWGGLKQLDFLFVFQHRDSDIIKSTTPTTTSSSTFICFDSICYCHSKILIVGMPMGMIYETFYVLDSFHLQIFKSCLIFRFKTSTFKTVLNCKLIEYMYDPSPRVRLEFLLFFQGVTFNCWRFCVPSQLSEASSENDVVVIVWSCFFFLRKTFQIYHASWSSL